MRPNWSRCLNAENHWNCFSPSKGTQLQGKKRVNRKGMTTLDRLRAGVMLARDAVKAVSLTAMEALREGATYIGMVGETNELVDPFATLMLQSGLNDHLKNYPNWLSGTVKNSRFVKQETSITHSNISLTSNAMPCAQCMPFAEEPMISLMVIGQIDSQEARAKWTLKLCLS